MLTKFVLGQRLWIFIELGPPNLSKFYLTAILFIELFIGLFLFRRWFRDGDYNALLRLLLLVFWFGILKLPQSLYCVSFSHVCRDGNFVTYNLARHAFHVICSRVNGRYSTTHHNCISSQLDFCFLILLTTSFSKIYMYIYIIQWWRSDFFF